MINNKNQVIMNSRLLIICFVFLSIFCKGAVCAGQTSGEDTKVIVDINKTQIKWSDDIERSGAMSVIDVFWSTLEKELEFSLFNIGETEVYVYDINQNLVSQEVTSTSIPTSIFISVPVSGYYYICLISEKWYADGLTYLH